MNMKDVGTSLALIIGCVLFLTWERNYSNNTAKIANETAEIQKQIDMLKVPEKPIDYWENKEFKINWYAEDKNDRANKVKVGSKKASKSSNTNNRNLRNNKNNNISYKISSNNISMDVITNYIKEKEGFKSKAYRDGCLVKKKICPRSKIRYSNGYGTLAKSKYETISKKVADQRLRAHIRQNILPKLKNVKFDSKNQMYASIDFAYNVGHNTFRNEIVNKKGEINCAKMTNYVVHNGKVNKGLERRRFENFVQCSMLD